MPHDFNLDRPTGVARDIRIAAAEILAVLWTKNYAAHLAEPDSENARDIEVARRHCQPIIILRMGGAPPIPRDRFPITTRVVDMPGDPAAGARVLEVIEREGYEHLPLLRSLPEGT